MNTLKMTLSHAEKKRLEFHATVQLRASNVFKETLDFTTIWFRSVVDFIRNRGDEIMPRALRDAEIKIFDKGLAKEYFYALKAIVKPEEHDLDEHEQIMFIITASPEERLKAVMQVNEYLNGSGK